MKPASVGKQIRKTHPALGRRGASRARFRSAVESGVLATLLLAVVASAIVGSWAVLLCAIVGAWLALTAIVGLRNVLDAGCAFMLVCVGIVLVVDLAHRGPVSLLH